MGNAAFISGNIMRDAEFRQSKNGTGYFVPFSVITERSYKDRSSVLQKYTVRHRVVVYGKETYLRNHILPRAKEGAFVAIHGEIRNKTFDGDDGNKVNLSEIVVDTPSGTIEFPPPVQQVALS